MKNFFSTAMLFILAMNLATAQQSQKLQGIVLDAEQKGLAFASVILHNGADSTILKLEMTGDDGSFTFTNIAAANYYIRISYVGLPEFSGEIFQLKSGQDLVLSDITMNPPGNELEQVTVTAQRPLLELKPGKMVFNVDGSINATGNTAFELLRKAPGVVIDNNDNVTILGKAGVVVYIDGKPSPLSASDLAAQLKTIQASEIDLIEIITNPSAKYDAEGNAGIINIKMKKDKGLGSNANINLGYSQGSKMRYNGSVSTNYRNKNMNVFGTYGYNSGENYNFLLLDRQQNGNRIVNDNRLEDSWDGHNFKAGADFYLNKKSTVGVIINGYLSDGENSSQNRSEISTISNNRIDSILIANNNGTFDRENLNFNLNYRFDAGNDKTLNIDADYGMFRNTSSDNLPNTYFDGTETEALSIRNYYNEAPTDIDIYTLKLDYEMPAWKGALSLGAKSAYVVTDNTFDWYNVSGENRFFNADRSNSFKYTENVNAAYVNYNKKFGKFDTQVGLRVEQTNSEGNLTTSQPVNDKDVKRNYTNFFPSAGVTFQANEKNSLQLNYSRRINRPSYQDLNPFKSILDELTFEQGNAFLNPEYTNSIQLTHTYNYSINTTFRYSHTKDLITRITDQAPDNINATYITWLNLDSQSDFELGLSGAVPLAKWWNTYTSLSGYHRRNKADYGDGKVVDINVTAFSLYNQHTFRLPMDFSLEVSGWYSSPSVWGANFKTEDMWSLDAGIQKKVLKGNGNIKLSFSDIFKTQVWSMNSEFGGLIMSGSGGWDSRRVKVNFSYLIGNKAVKSSKRKTGMEDENKRIKTEN